MTLCIAWIRQEPKSTNKELVFATDSMLTGGGEVWKHGVKLFELPRKDCLLCFAGDTSKAYPLILNLQTAIQFNQKIMKQHTDLRQVLEYLCGTFTEVINSLVYELGDMELYNPYTAAKFIFGG
jgi:ATP-dependent protease HslVU (ClpYQ) peptidase subunit